MKLEVVVDGKRLLLVSVVAAANIAETAFAEPAIDDVPIRTSCERAALDRQRLRFRSFARPAR
jgi:hypothetical protein